MPSPLPTTTLKLLSELLQDRDFRIPSDTTELMFQRLVQEYGHELAGIGIQGIIEKTIPLLIEREKGLQEHIKTEIFPRCLETNLDTDYIKKCNLVFKTYFSLPCYDQEPKLFCKKVNLLTSSYILRLVSTGEESERSFKLLLHLCVSSKEKVLKQVLTCLRVFINSESREDEFVNLIQLLHTGELKPALEGLQYTLLTTLYTYSPDNTQSLVFSCHRREIFWDIIQCGLINADSLKRKQSLFLLKRISSFLCQHPCEDLPSCVAFMGSSDLQADVFERWETVIYLLETFEETQTHILRASLPLLYSLADFIRREELVHADSLHFSWLITLFNRLFSHESRLVQSWGIHAVLSCPLSHSTQPCVAKFVTESLTLAMNNPSFFTSDAATIVDLLTNLYSQFIEAFTEAETETQLASLFSNLISLSEIPLFYLSFSLSRLAPRAVIGTRTLLVLRKLFSKTVLAHSLLLIRAIKCFILRMLTQLINPKGCTWADIIMILTDMDIDFTTPSEWKELNGLIKKLQDIHSAEDIRYLDCCCKHLINVYFGMEDPGSSDRVMRKNLTGGQLISDIPSISSNNPELPNIQGIVIGILTLIVEKNSGDVSSELREFDQVLSSVTQTLLNVGTHPYLLQDNVERALILANSFIAGTLVNKLTNLKSSSRMYIALKSNLTELVVHLIGYESRIDLVQLLSNIREFQRIRGNLREPIWELLAVRICALCEQELKVPSKQEGKMRLTNRACNLISVIAYLLSMVDEAKSLWTTLSPAVKMITGLIPIIVEGNIKFIDSTKNISTLITATLEIVKYSQSLGHPICDLSEVALVSTLKQLAVVTDCPGLLSILQVLHPLLSALYSEHPKLCAECVDACWLGVREEAINSEQLHLLVPSFLQTCLNEEMLLQSRLHSEQWDASSLFTQVIEWGKKKIGVMYMIVKHFGWIWNSHEAVACMSIHSQQIVEMFLISPEFIKSIRQQIDGAIFAYRLKEFDFSDWKGYLSQNYSDLYRIELLGLLTSINVSEQVGYSCLLTHLIHELLRIETEKTVGRYKSCTFNSRFHRDKLRTWQVILLLIGSLLSTSTSHCEGNQQLLLSLLKEHIPANSQPSIRCYLEWSAALLISHDGSLFAVLLAEMNSLFSTPSSLLPFVCVSYINVLMILFRNIITLQNESFRETAALLIAIMSSNNSQLRYTSLHALNQLRQLSTTNQSILAPLLQHCPDVSGQSEHLGWMTSIGSECELSFASVLKHMPSYFGLEGCQHLELTELAERGWREWDRGHIIPLGNTRIWNKSKKQKSPMEECIVEIEKDLGIREVMQKKIMPWGKSCGDVERFDEKSNQKGELILITSLIDKPTNLGGMCRTCEVFGAKGMVVSNKRVLEDKSFTSLSVSAERWLPIEEVKVDQLPSYIRRVREGGYTVIGVEQTPNSTSLDKFLFPKRSALLLGHEKLGIPVQLLELMDVCIQIPQIGIIRSLNVHVSSAIAIWSYAAQHLINNES